MSQNREEPREISWGHLPEDVKIDILNNLTLTDLSLASKTCKSFLRLTRKTIKTYRRHDSPFTANNEFSHGNVPVKPDIHPESGLAICFHEHTNMFKLLNLATGATIASVLGTDHYPVSLKFSETGRFAVIFFRTEVQFYALSLVKEQLTLLKEVKFDVRQTEPVPPSGEKVSYYLERMLISFSGNDTKPAVAYISETQGPMRHVRFRCLILSLHEKHALHDKIIDFERLGRPAATEKAITFYLKTKNREALTFSDIQMNANPLRFYIPPGCMHEDGFLLDPTNPHALVTQRFLNFNPHFGNLIRFCFSTCGQYYFEVWHGLSGAASNITIRKFHIATLLPVNMIMIPMVDFRTVLTVLISKDGNLAVIVQGDNTGDASEVTAWYAVNLYGDGHLYIRCKEPIPTTQFQDYNSRTFDLSDDGQLLSMSCDLKEETHYDMVKVFETATGQCIDALTCAEPSGVNWLHQEWRTTGRSACHHFLRGRRHCQLSMFCVGDQCTSFAHAS